MIIVTSSHDYRDVILFEKAHFQNVFRPHENARPAFFKFLRYGLKTVFEKLFSRDVFVWTVDFAVEIKLRSTFKSC